MFGQVDADSFSESSSSSANSILHSSMLGSEHEATVASESAPSEVTLGSEDTLTSSHDATDANEDGD